MEEEKNTKKKTLNKNKYIKKKQELARRKMKNKIKNIICNVHA